MTAAMLRRFALEAEVLGRLQHPGIAQIYEAGVAKTGFGPQPYFAMEFVEGRGLSEYVVQANLAPRKRLELLASICDAVHYAHQKGVIHRDLKPGNIVADASGRCKILDFGLARTTDMDIQNTTMHTEAGQVLGTLAYMSPEQAAGNSADVDLRSDVYSLGVIGYELLTGRLPHDLTRLSFPEAVRVIREKEPVRMSSITRRLRGDAETIIARAMEKSKERRYQSASELSADIHRYLRHEPIVARPASVWYQVAKFSRRNKVLVSGVVAVFLALALGCIGTGLGLHQALQAQEAQRLSLDESLKQKALAQEESRNAELRLAEGLISQGDALLMSGGTTEAKAAFREAYAKMAELGAPTLRAEAALSIAQAISPPPLFSLKGHADWVLCVSASFDGNRVVSGGRDGTLRLWDIKTGRLLQQFDGHTGSVLSVAFSADSKTILSGGVDNSVRLWNVETGKQLQTLTKHTGHVTGVAFGPADGVVVSCSLDATLRVWDLKAGSSLIYRYPKNPIKCVAVHGDVAVSGCQDGTFNVWDLEAKQARFQYEHLRGTIRSVAISKDGKRAVSGGDDQLLNLWDIQTGELLSSLHTPAGLLAVAFHPDGKRVIAASADQTVRIWDLETGRSPVSFTDESASPQCMAVSFDGKRAFTGGNDHRIKVWDLEPGRDVHTLRGHAKEVRSVAYSPDGSLLLSASTDGTLRLWDVATAKELRTLPGGTVHANIAMSFNGRHAAAASEQKVYIWDIGTRKQIQCIHHEAPISTVALSPDGKHVLTSTANHCYLWELQTGKKLRKFQGHADTVVSSAFSPDGRTLITGSHDKNVRAWDVESGKLVHTFSGHRDIVWTVAVTPDGKTAVSGSEDRTVRHWDLRTGNELRRMERAGLGTPIAFNAEARWALSGGWHVRSSGVASSQNALKLWDLNGGRELATIERRASGVRCLALSADGRRGAAGRTDGTIWSFDFSRALTTEKKRLSPAARDVLAERDDPPSLAVLGEWYAHRGQGEWAIELLEKARSQGVDVSSLTLARCYWQVNNLEAARREFERALTREEAPVFYLQLYLTALDPEAHMRP
jgi:WD40 repeat protein